MKIAPGAVIAGRYRLEKRLAIGGMGSLWTAHHVQLDARVAIKFMDPNHAGAAVARQRFEREAKMAASLKSAHVVHVHDYGVEDDRPYIVMEFLQGEDLGKRLKRERRLAIPVTSSILVQIARGLRRAHDAGLIHRDLKPPNIFMARGEDEEIVKILDFGIAKNTTEPALGEGTKTGELMGSPHFMSPEQIRGAKDIDYRSDLWSLGVILFRSVVGALPFKGDSVGSVIAQILADPIPVPSAVYPSLTPAVDAYFARAFMRDRNGRFQSAREMAEAFAVLAAEAGGAGPSRARLLLSSSPTGDAPMVGATPAPFTLSPLTPTPFTAGVDPTATPRAIQRVAPDRLPADLLSAAPPPSASVPSFPGTPGPLDPPFTPRPPALSASSEATGGLESQSTLSQTSSGSGLTATGGPLVQSTITPPMKPSRAWLGAGAVSVLLVGVGIAFATSGSSSQPAAGGEAAAASPSASETAPLPSAAPPVASAAALPAAPSASADPGAGLPAKSASPANKAPFPTKTGPAPSVSVKKKPTWGF